jgi:taurine dioxygenase
MPEGVQLWNHRPYETITVDPVAGALGAEISNVDLSQPLTDDLFGEIYTAFVRYQVIFFRDQDLTPDQYLAFAKRWGDIHLHPFMKGLDDHPEILELIKTETDTYAFGNTWHSDQMFAPKPAKITMLYALETPPAGGDTIYASLYHAYDALSDGMKEMVGRLNGHNCGDKRKGQDGRSRAERYKGASGMKMKDPGDVQTDSVHPLVRTHVDTGRKALYMGVHTKSLDGFTEAESRVLLDQLQDHIKRPEFTCRFRWAPGSLALWDNRCCQHYAVNDYAGQRRRMHRITIKGEEAPF